MSSGQQFAASLEIRRLKKDGTLDEGAPKVCFKRDGQRFDCEYTLKLLVETYYEFQVNLRPPLPLHSVSVQGSAVTIVESIADSGQGQGTTYSFKWDTIKAESNKRKKRTTVKFYKLEDEDHLSWGTSLGRVDYECELKPGMTTMDIVKTTFR